jgi:fumarate reductase subunit C
MTDEHTYRRPISTWWWLRKRSHFLFVMRELSSIFVAWFVVFLLMLVAAIARSATAYNDFLDWAAHSWVVALNVIGLAFILLHTVTWFALTPKAMVLRVRGRRVKPLGIIASQYAGLAAVSAFLFWVVKG